MERRPDPSDGRGVLVRITDAGRTVIQDRHAERVRRLAGLAGRLGPGDRSAIAAALPALARIAEIGKKEP